ncbi:MAG: hypothetical protein U0165_03590 [Polyangiaceae bacterium]
MKRGNRDASAAVDANELDSVRRAFGYLSTLYGAHCIEPQDLIRAWESRVVAPSTTATTW